MAKKKKSSKNPKVYEFTVTLKDTSPAVWRKFLAHEFIELGELHMLIQMSMDWDAKHLYSFEINGKTYSDTESAIEMNCIDAEATLLCDVINKSKKFHYTYDFGDNWLHEVEITKILDHDPRMKYPVCTGGENACPPEDCGGVGGFEDLKSTLAGPDSEEKNEILSWLGGFYNPHTFDANFINKHFLWIDAEDDLIF